MVVRNKFYRIIDKYRKLLDKNKKTYPRSVKTKNRILDFYIKNNRWPSRLSENKIEKKLGMRLENFLSKKNYSYDSNLRRIVMVSGRKSNHKRNHDIPGFKKQIIEFIKTYGHVPAQYREQKIKGEATLRARLDYYVSKKHDMAFLGEIYKEDKCHRSGIPMRYRQIINSILETDKPLVRLVK